ncbi:HIT domain-containing protein [Podospora aff. communis PSN243]|uniref:HIT domain-containing protein n=1 Tax=Podospora aff. communis PSN243 TaxID=3040156 RepID=A0AAV9GR98_9PEZI|nr:HIT domain-containing protein [Podospora aff. communis PSN243]
MAPPLPSSTFDTITSNSDASCPFCHIAITYPPFSPLSPPPSSSPVVSPTLTSPSPQTFVVLSTPLLIAFLDIMPLSPGHLLLCPRSHAPKLTDASASEARELGYYLRILSGAVARATGVKDWNVVQNNGMAAAQVVEHMHFHVIPRPGLRAKERFTSTMFGRGQREELDDEEGEELAGRIRECVAEVLKEEGGRERKGKL